MTLASRPSPHSILNMTALKHAQHSLISSKLYPVKSSTITRSEGVLGLVYNLKEALKSPAWLVADWVQSMEVRVAGPMMGLVWWVAAVCGWAGAEPLALSTSPAVDSAAQSQPQLPGAQSAVSSQQRDTEHAALRHWVTRACSTEHCSHAAHGPAGVSCCRKREY